MDVHWAWRPPRICADSLLALLVRPYLYTISGLSSDLEHL